ncbi:hypothetical protein WMY93_004271 [Mugilogobius chulae]|uniref:AIG1-type G domain-containing protein n=1 Tax=Mugilogobius chulae TaxID=88201 RepID=A0AAW0PUG9_9GOBI
MNSYLQSPEDFTEQHKTRLESVLESFSEQAFDQSLVLMSTPREERELDFMDTYMQWWMNPTQVTSLRPHRRPRLIGPTAGHASSAPPQATPHRPHRRPRLIGPPQATPPRLTTSASLKLLQLMPVVPASTQFQLSPLKASPAHANQDRTHIHRSSSYEFLPPVMSELRLVLLGNSRSLKVSVGNLLLEKTEFSLDSPDNICAKGCGRFKDKSLTVIYSPDQMLTASLQDVNQFIQEIKTLSAPGPHVFLLVLQPEDFTEQHKTRLESVLESFSEQAFDRSLVLMSTPREERELDFMDTYMQWWMKTEEEPSLNLVLFGRTGAGKTSVAESILGRAQPPAASSPGQCVKLQGEVCGRWVSLVELPALSGKPLETVMQQCLSCISLCGPEGVHAFILVLPLSSLTDEDKAELKIIQDTLGSQVHPFTMILITVDSNSTDPDVIQSVKEDTDIQELSQSCGGGSLIFNLRDQQPVSELLESVETLRDKNEPRMDRSLCT